MISAKSFTVLCFTLSLALDYFSSVFLVMLGFVETNRFYALLGEGFWIWYVFMNAALLVLLLAASEKWWWAYRILWIPTIAHLICGVHNLGLF